MENNRKPSINILDYVFFPSMTAEPAVEGMQQLLQLSTPFKLNSSLQNKLENRKEY